MLLHSSREIETRVFVITVCIFQDVFGCVLILWISIIDNDVLLTKKRKASHTKGRPIKKSLNCLINFIFMVFWCGVGDHVVGMSLVDLIHGFDTRFFK